MDDAILTFLVGFTFGFTLAWVTAMYWLFKKEEKEVKNNHGYNGEK